MRTMTLIAAAFAAPAALAAPTLFDAANDVISDGMSVSYDVNGDSVNDLTVSFLGQSTFFGFSWIAQVQSTGGVAVSQLSPTVAQVFAQDEMISVGGSPVLSAATEALGTSFGIPQNQTGFIGFTFAAADGMHTGWAELTIAPSAFGINFGNVVVNRIGYETTANTAIGAGVVPAPAAAAMFGLTGLAATRRRR